jgi:hypothetical protein
MAINPNRGEVAVNVSVGISTNKLQWIS